QASGAKEDSLIKIYLDAGSELNVLQSKLGPNDTYEVDTPNSTMAVRGTTFRVTVYTAEDGMVYTLLEVTDGVVNVRLKTKDGSYNGVSRDFGAGESALIRGNFDFSEFVTSDLLDDNDLDMEGVNGTDKLLLAYDKLPEDGMARLIALLENGGLIKEGEDKEPETVKEDKMIIEPSPSPSPSPSPTPGPEDEDENDGENGDENDEDNEDGMTLPSNSIKARMWEEARHAVVGTDAETGWLILSEGTLFDTQFYRTNNPDVVKNFGGDETSLIAHYLNFGKMEDRPPNERESMLKAKAWADYVERVRLEEEEAERLRREEEERNRAANAAPAEDNQSGGSSGVPKAYVDNSSRVWLNGTQIGSYRTVNGHPSIAFDSSGVLANSPVSITSPFDINGYTISSLKDINWIDSSDPQSDVTVSLGGHTVEIGQNNNGHTYKLDNTDYTNNGGVQALQTAVDAL
nr:hypothetical protein [Lachnospiraceae bacterium]